MLRIDEVINCEKAYNIEAMTEVPGCFSEKKWQSSAILEEFRSNSRNGLGIRKVEKRGLTKRGPFDIILDVVASEANDSERSLKTIQRKSFCTRIESTKSAERCDEASTTVRF